MLLHLFLPDILVLSGAETWTTTCTFLGEFRDPLSRGVEYDGTRMLHDSAKTIQNQSILRVEKCMCPDSDASVSGFYAMETTFLVYELGLSVDNDERRFLRFNS